MMNEEYRFDVQTLQNGDVETHEGYFEWSGRHEDLIKQTYTVLDGRVYAVDGDHRHEVFEGLGRSGTPLKVAEGEVLENVIRAQKMSSRTS